MYQCVVDNLCEVTIDTKVQVKYREPISGEVVKLVAC